MGYLDGFGVVLKKWFGVQTDSGARVTLEYPEEVRPKPERFHGRHVLNRYEDGMEKCIGCELCAAVCPAKCIYVRGKDNDPEDPTSPGERFGYVYEINYLRCIHCDLCVEACPTEAITETKLFEFSFTNRDDAIYTKNELLVGDDGRPKQLPWENWDGGFDPARDTSGWMRATAPQGNHDFKDIVAWAGELGYGVRPPERGDVLDEVGPVPSVASLHDAHDDHIAHTPDEGRGVDAVHALDDGTADDAAFDDAAFDDAARFDTPDPHAPQVQPVPQVPEVDEADDTVSDVIADAALFDAGSGAPASVADVVDDATTVDETAEGAIPDAAHFNAGPGEPGSATGAAGTATDDDAGFGQSDPDDLIMSGEAGTFNADEHTLADDTTAADSADVVDGTDVVEGDAEDALTEAADAETLDDEPEPPQEKPRAPGHFDAGPDPEPEPKKKGWFRR